MNEASETQEAATDGQSIESAIPAAVDTPAFVDNGYKSDPGYLPVDLSHLPDEQRKPIEDRINYMFRQVKDQGRTLGQYRSVAEQQAAMIEELRNGTAQIVNHLTERNFEETESGLMQQLMDAQASGDTKAFLEANNKLVDLKVRKATAPKQEQPKPQEKQYRSATEIAKESAEGGTLSQEEYRVVDAWQNQRDQNGQLLRPWAHTNDVMSDKTYQAVVAEAQAVFNNPRFSSLSIDQRLAEVDRRMGLSRSNNATNGQAVMGGNLTNSRKSATIRLSPEQEKIAIRMNVGAKKSDKPRTDAEKISAYIEQMKVHSNGSKR